MGFSSWLASLSKRQDIGKRTFKKYAIFKSTLPNKSMRDKSTIFRKKLLDFNQLLHCNFFSNVASPVMDSPSSQPYLVCVNIRKNNRKAQ